MEINRFAEKAVSLVKKYRYVLIVVLAGILLLSLPSGTKQKQKSNTEQKTQPVISMEERLQEILSQIEGAGKVSVMLTIAAGEETIYQSDKTETTGTENTSSKNDTVIVNDSDRNQNGLIIQVNPVRYQGAVIVCQGAENAKVRFAIAEAVANLTGLGTNKVSIVKMK